jgi:hypothetical protein
MAIQVSVVRKWRPLVLVGVLLLGIAFLLANPLRRPEPAVHAWLLSKVPRGSSEKELYRMASTMGWQVNGAWPGRQPHSDWGGIDGATVVWLSSRRIWIRFGPSISAGA